MKDTGIRIKDILEMKPLENGKLLAGAAGADKMVTRVNVMADPDILNWVDEGEFLLTTGYFFKTTKLEAQLNLIRECSAKNLSGIGIKIFPYLESLPNELIDLANQCQFPLIELDYEVPFTDIMMPVFQGIFDRQSSVIRKVETLHNETMDVVLKGGNINDILRSLSKSLENPVFLKDYHFEEINALDDAEDSEELKHSLEEHLKTALKPNVYTSRFGKTITDKVNIDGREVERMMVPIMVKNNLYGYLVTFGVRRDLNHYDALYLESTSSIVALEFLKRISVQEVENKYKGEFFEDLISFDEKRKQKAIERANYYRFDKDAFYSVFTIRLNKLDTGTVTTDEEYNQVITKAMYMVDMVCKEEGRTYIIASKGKKINVLFMWKSIEDQKKFTARISNSIKESLDLKVSQSTYRIGIGRVYKGIEQVYKSLKDAEKSVEAAKTYVNQQIIDFETLGIYKIFCQDHLKDELLSFYKSTLEPLVIYDRKRDTELVKSLIIYFETNGNLKKMSEMLFTHYNTVLYRINRIQEITGKDLEDEGDRYGLQTALKIMKILDL